MQAGAFGHVPSAGSGTPENEAYNLSSLVGPKRGKVDEQHLLVDMAGHSIGHHCLARA